MGKATKCKTYAPGSGPHPIPELKFSDMMQEDLPEEVFEGLDLGPVVAHYGSHMMRLDVRGDRARRFFGSPKGDEGSQLRRWDSQIGCYVLVERDRDRTREGLKPVRILDNGKVEKIERL